MRKCWIVMGNDYPLTDVYLNEADADLRVEKEWKLDYDKRVLIHGEKYANLYTPRAYWRTVEADLVE